MRPRVLVIGLDCAPPALVFDHYRDSLPNLRALMDRGVWATLRSTIPPITVPAWACMTSGRDPGELGLYGFRNRRKGSYEQFVATSRDMPQKRVWDWLGSAGKRVAVLFVPLTSPPTPVNGHLVSCFLAEPGDRWTYPLSLAERLNARHGEYLADIDGFRELVPEQLLEALHRMAKQHFDIAEDVWTADDPDFLMMVEMGPDRLQHALWEYMHPESSSEPDHPYRIIAREYYAYLDRRIGEFLKQVDSETTVLIVSDHGARSMAGGVRINEWLRRAGMLALRRDPVPGVGIAEADVDWSRTQAWAEGGYYARIFLNVRGREPNGVIVPGDYDRVRAQLADQLRVIECEGTILRNTVLRPDEVYRKVRGNPPDLIVYFADLAYRSIGSFGSEILTSENDHGSDGCNHDPDGILIAAGRGITARGRIDDRSIYDIAVTISHLMGVAPPPGLLGRIISRREG